MCLSEIVDRRPSALPSPNGVWGAYHTFTDPELDLGKGQ